MIRFSQRLCHYGVWFFHQKSYRQERKEEVAPWIKQGEAPASRPLCINTVLAGVFHLVHDRCSVSGSSWRTFACIAAKYRTLASQRCRLHKTLPPPQQLHASQTGLSGVILSDYRCNWISNWFCQHYLQLYFTPLNPQTHLLVCPVVELAPASASMTRGLSWAVSETVPSHACTQVKRLIEVKGELLLHVG